jgi:hypothetical protein
MTEPRKLTDAEREAAAEYLANGGVHCLFCRSENIEPDTIKMDGPNGRSEVQCLDCGRTWVDVYRLTAVEPCDEDGDEIETVYEQEAGILIEVRDDEADFTAAGDLGVALIDWDEVDDETDVEVLRGLLGDVEALPRDCDEDGKAVEALRQRIRTLEEEKDDDDRDS